MAKETVNKVIYGCKNFLEPKQLTKLKKVLINTEEIKTALAGLNSAQKEKIIIAYEPIWSIGTGIIPTSDEIRDMVNYIKDFVKDRYETTIKVVLSFLGL